MEKEEISLCHLYEYVLHMYYVVKEVVSFQGVWSINRHGM